MNATIKRALYGMAGTGAVTLVMAGAVFVPGVLQAQDAPTATPAAPSATAPATRLGRMGDEGSALADALGITVEELQAAQQKAAAAAIEAAVEQGLLTEEQAAQLQARGAGRFLGGHGLPGFGRFGNEIDGDALLADALGITVAELDAARDTAFSSRLAQAVADGAITQEQADLAQAQRALHEFLAPRLQSAYDQALQDAVAEGIVTQEQVDALQAQGLGLGRGGFPGDDFGGRGPGRGGHGRGGHGMMAPGGMFDRGGRFSAPGSQQTPAGEPTAVPQSNG